MRRGAGRGKGLARRLGTSRLETTTHDFRFETHDFGSPATPAIPSSFRPMRPPSMTRSALPLLTLLLPLSIVAGVDRAVPRHATTVVAPADTGRRYTDADVQFMQGMIAHHAQALAMTSLVPTRTTRDVKRLLAQRIEVSQRDEIALMRHWLEVRH